MSGSFLSRNRARSPLTAALGLLVLTLGLSYPVPFHLSERLIGTGDDAWQFPWNNFVFRQQVLQGSDPYYTDAIFFPAGTSLALHSYTEFNGAVGLLLSPLFNEIAQTNLAILLSTFLTAFGTWLLVRELTNSAVAAFFAAIAFAFCPFRMMRMGGHVNFALTQWFPLAVWSFLQLAKIGKIRYAAALGLFFSFAHYSNQYYTVYLLIILGLLLFAGIWFFQDWRKPAFFGKLSISALLAILLLTPVLIRYYKDYKEGNLRSRESDELARETAVRLKDYLHIGVMNPAIMHLLPAESVRGPYTKLSPGLVALITACAGLGFAIRDRQKIFLLFALVGVFFVLLSLGPEIRVGSVDVLLPYSFLMKIPLMNHVRLPTRFVVIVSFSTAILAAYAILLLRRNNTFVARAMICILFVLLLIELSPVPVRTQSLDSPGVFREIARQPSSTLLTLPYRFDGSATNEIKYQIVHQKKMLNGRISRRPVEQRRFFSEIPVARVFEQTTRYEKIPYLLLEKDRTLAPVFRSFFDIRYVAFFPRFHRMKQVEKDLLQLFPDARLLSAEKNVSVYQLPELSLRSYEFRGLEPGFRFFLYDGWEIGDLKGRRTFLCSEDGAQLLLPVFRKDQKADLELDFVSEQLPLKVQILAGGSILKMEPFRDSNVVRITLDGAAVEKSHRLITLQIEGPDPVALQRLKIHLR